MKIFNIQHSLVTLNVDAPLTPQKSQNILYYDSVGRDDDVVLDAIYPHSRECLHWPSPVASYQLPVTTLG